MQYKAVITAKGWTYQGIGNTDHEAVMQAAKHDHEADPTQCVLSVWVFDSYGQGTLLYTSTLSRYLDDIS